MPALAVVAVICTLAGAAAAAGFEDGLAAYDAGNHYEAYLAWLPLAKDGDADAQAAIADLYHSELLGRASGELERRRLRNTAAYWYRQAARCGHVISQLNLGDFYARGIGVERDPEQAYFWLGLAARGGSAWSANRLRELAAAMSAERVARAEAAVTGWRPDEHCGEPD